MQKQIVCTGQSENDQVYQQVIFLVYTNIQIFHFGYVNLMKYNYK